MMMSFEIWKVWLIQDHKYSQSEILSFEIWKLWPFNIINKTQSSTSHKQQHFFRSVQSLDSNSSNNIYQTFFILLIFLFRVDLLALCNLLPIINQTFFAHTLFAASPLFFCFYCFLKSKKYRWGRAKRHQTWCVSSIRNNKLCDFQWQKCPSFRLSIVMNLMDVS